MNLSDEHYTPHAVFKAMDLVFDIDVAAPINHLHRNCPAKRYFTEKENGLVQDWHGLVWMNPPFSKPSPWVEKFIEHGNGVALLVVSRSKWFRDIWQKADALVPTEYNLKFDRPDHEPKQISFQTFLFAMGKQAVKGLENVATARVRY